MAEPRDDYTQSDRERQILCDITYMEILKKMIQMNLFTKQNRNTHKYRKQIYGNQRGKVEKQ